MASDTLKYLHHLKKDPVFNCGQCLFCRKKRAYELACKCVLHSSLYQQNCFITLTYDETKKNYHNNFDYREIQLFKKRLRKHVYPKKIEIFNVHEYGKNGKKHWHLIVFNHDFSDKEIYTRTKAGPIYSSKKLEKLWPYGFNTIADVSEGTAMYQAQYCEKDFKHGHVGTSKKSHSKHSGIGKPYFLTHYRQILSLGYIPINGKKLPVPRSFQKIAHRHYCHYYEQSAFYKTSTREPLYRPFTKTQPLKELADLWPIFKAIKQEKIKELEKEWDDVISQYLTTGLDPDFMKSNANALYDLKNKTGIERF